MLEKAPDALDEAEENLAQVIGHDKSESPLLRRAAKLKAEGKISDKQYDRMIELGLGEIDKSGISELTFRSRRG